MGIETMLAGAAVDIGIGALNRSNARDDYKGQLNDQREYTRKLTRELPKQVRLGAERAGFNPLTVLSNGGLSAAPAPAAPVSFGGIGTNFAMAALDADQAAKDREIQLAALEMDKQRLELLLADTKLKADVPGVYGRGLSTGSSNGAANRNDGAGGDLGSTSGVAPHRDVKIEPYSSGPGLTEINNALTGGPVVVPGADGEPWGIDELATAVVVGMPQLTFQWGKRFGEWVDEKHVDATWEIHKSMREKEARKQRNLQPKKSKTSTGGIASNDMAFAQYHNWRPNLY